MGQPEVVLCGAGGHAKVVADIVERVGEYRLKGILDDCQALWGQQINGHLVLGGIGSFLLDHEWGDLRFIVAIGDNRARKAVADRIAAAGGVFATAIHPSAQVGSDVLIEPGTVVMANAVINAGTRIGGHSIINTAATVDHDCVLEAFVHLAPGTHLAGHVQVGTGTLLGIGACAIPCARIGRWSVVGAGATVIRDIPDCVTAVGTPAFPVNSKGKQV